MWAQGGRPPLKSPKKGTLPPPKKPPIAIKISEGPPLDFLARPRMITMKENKPLFCRLSNTKSYRTVNEWLVIWFVIWCHVCLSYDVVSAFRNSRSDKVNRQTTSVKSSTGRKGRSNESYFATRPYYYPHTPLLRRHSSADPRSHKRYLTTKRLVPDYHTIPLLTYHRRWSTSSVKSREHVLLHSVHTSSMFITCFISIAIWQILYLYKLSF